LSFFVACFALFAHVPLVWHSEPSILNLNLMDFNKRRENAFDLLLANNVRWYRFHV
jgi:hypothetical protein